jgi:MFS family permease
MAANFFDGPLLSVLLPLYANQELGSSVALGLLVGTFGAAAATGALVYGAVHRRLPRRATLVGAFALVGLPFWVLAVLPALPWAMAAMAVSGLASGPINPIAATLVQERVAPHLRASVFGAVTAGAMTAMPAGVFVAGYLVEWFGLSAVVTGVAAGYVAVTAALATAPAFRRIRFEASAPLQAVRDGQTPAPYTAHPERAAGGGHADVAVGERVHEV